MASTPPANVHRKRQRQPTDASRQLFEARRRARLHLKQLGAALDVHYRTITRWEVGEVHPSKAQWSKVVAYLARFVPQDAIELARVAGVASPVPEAVPVDVRAIEEVLLRAADLLDVSPRRVRAAIREVVRVTAGARGTLVDLARAVEEKATGDEIS
jgi:hypothetical protein